MNNHSSCLLFMVCLAMGSDSVLADELTLEKAVAVTNAAALGRQSLTLEQAVQNAVANNRELAAARVRIEEAKARLQQAGLWPNPELELAGRFDNAFDNEGEHTVAAAVNQPFSVSGRVGAQKSVAQVDIERALVEVADLERRTAGAVRTAFTELIAIEEQLKLQQFL